MALIPISVPQFPNVPIAPGVPAVLRDVANSIVDQVNSKINDALGVPQFPNDDVWGIFTDEGEPIILADSVKMVEIEGEFIVSDYPIEEGGFESYNKVQRPKQYQITLLKGGPLGDRTEFLQSVDEACASLDLYTISTPEIPYSNVTLVRNSMKRTATEGKTLLTVEIYAREVRTTATAEFSNTKEPNGAADQNGGAVQAQPPSPSVAAAVATPLGQLTGLF